MEEGGLCQALKNGWVLGGECRLYHLFQDKKAVFGKVSSK